MKQALILKTGGTIPVIAQEKGDFEHWIDAGLSLPQNELVCVSVFEGETLPDPSTISSIVITGSPAMVTENLDWIAQSQQYILKAIAAGIPVLGICFGHQLLAQALGGKVDWHPGGREIGTVQVKRNKASDNDPVFGNLPESFPVHSTHMQTIMALPGSATVLLSNDFESHHGVRFTNNAWGVQFHPEFDAAIMRRYIEERSAQITREGLQPSALLSSVDETPEALQVLINFAALVRKNQASN